MQIGLISLTFMELLRVLPSEHLPLRLMLVYLNVLAS